MTRLIVMGGGLIGRRHAEQILAHPRASLAALVDPDPNVASDLAVTRCADLKDAPDADGVIIATPTPLHAEHAHLAARKGLPMLIEKPVAGTIRDADGLQSLTQPILVGHHRRHHPKAKALKSLLDAGGIGRPVTATLIWAMRKPDAYFQDNWRATNGSPVMINLVHDLDLIRYWFGEITEIAALPGTTLRGTRVESGAVALATSTGPTITISFADTAPSPWGFEAATGENPNIGTTGQDMMWVTGTKGAVSFPSLTEWTGTDWSQPAQSHPPQPANGPAPLDAQLNHFLDVIAGKVTPLCTLTDGKAALEAALEIEAQMRERAA